VGAAVLGPIAWHWGTAAAVLVGGLLLAWVCYRAAIREGEEASRHLHAAFDLYRHEILKQMELDVPADDEAERALWQRLTEETVEPVVPIPGVAVTDGSATATSAKDKKQRPTAASPRAGVDRRSTPSGGVALPGCMVLALATSTTGPPR
jgi:hypothetical protein